MVGVVDNGPGSVLTDILQPPIMADMSISSWPLVAAASVPAGMSMPVAVGMSMEVTVEAMVMAPWSIFVVIAVRGEELSSEDASWYGKQDSE